MADEFPLESLRDAVRGGRVQWQMHALERLFERGLSRAQVVEAVLRGEVIESYDEDVPFARALILSTGDVPLHVVVGFDDATQSCHIVTAYRPDTEHFEPGFRQRRRSG